MRTTTYEYDGANDRVRETAADGAVTEYAYDSARKLVQITQRGSDDADAARAHHRRRAARADVQATTPPAGSARFQQRRRHGRDLRLRQREQQDAGDGAEPTPLPGGGTPTRTRVTRFGYDDDNRLVTQTFDPDGLNLVETLAYDKAGNVVRRTDANGNETTSTYDLANRLRSVTDALGQTTVVHLRPRRQPDAR